MTGKKPAAEVSINHDLIETLINEFYPELTGQPVEYHQAGWDNEIHRVGEHHAVRLPRREAAAKLVEHEHEWLPKLAGLLPLPIPTPTYAGKPAFGFPWPWSVVPWLPGIPLAHAPAFDAGTLMTQLASFLNALHVPAPASAPRNPFRGVPLVDKAEAVIEYIEVCADEFEKLDISTQQVKDLWIDLIDAPVFGAEPMWLHGDLHPLNILTRNGELSAVIDFGDVCSGDPATDIAVAWMVFDNEPDRLAFRKLLTVDGHSVDVHTWRRAQAWALALALAYLAHSADEPTLRRIGATTLRNLLG